MSDIQLLFAKSLMHMKLPRTRGILSFRNFRAGDSEKITQSSTRASNNESLQTNKPHRKSNHTYLDLPDPEKEQRSNSYLQNGKLNDLFTLCPSDNSRFLDSSLEKQANLLEVTASAAESSRVASLGPYTSSKIIISKLFEYFENPAKTHNLCRFSIQNDSLELLAYSVSVNGQCNQDLYEISPNKGYVPTGRSLEISVKFLGAEFDLERLTEDEIIIRSFCAGKETTRLVDFIHPKANFDSNFTAIPLKAFFRNPCEILTSNQALSLRPVEMALENDPKFLKARKRLKKLKNRGYCEKIFDRMQTVSENSQKELQKYHKQAQVMRDCGWTNLE
ncbi:unnamed protein product [Allacma fusca]|uniref:Uncharacterized protein n=1 Tax=Allacma fusca TaxID=39272 RepID=A0A8J2PWS1_9HEXA|nr:unnamed protein product [Allacma fusca]